MAYSWETKEEKDDWHSELEKQVLKESEGDARSEKVEAEERLKKESGMEYTTGTGIKETAYKHMESTKAEYHSTSEDDEEEREKRNY